MASGSTSTLSVSSTTIPRWTTKRLGPLLWIDLETTGLDHFKDKILEIAMATTTWDYTHRSVLVDCVLHAEPDDIKGVDDVVRVMHTKNKLFDECLKSTLTLDEADESISKILDANHPDCVAATGPKGLRKWHPAGNSVHFDVAFIQRCLPKVASRLDHRYLDVSSFGLIAKRDNVPYFPSANQNTHRALVDVYDSISLMKNYESCMMHGLSDY